MTRCSLLLFVTCLAPATAPAGDVRVETLTEENWDALVPRGKEVDAILGDVVIRNDHVIAVVAQPKATRNANMTVRSIGGQLIDLTTPGSQSDQLSAYYVGRRRYPFSQLSTRADEKGGAVHVRSKGTDDRPGVEVTYALGSDDRHLLVTTTYTNGTEKALKVVLEDDVRIDNRNESMRFSTTDDTDAFWVHDRFWEQAYIVEPVDARVRVSSTRGAVLRFEVGDAEPTAERTLEPGASIDVVRRFFAGGDLLEVRANRLAVVGTALQPTTLTVRDGANRPLADALVTVRHQAKTYGAARTDENGRIATRMPAGDYSLTVTTLGVMAGKFDIAVKEGDNEFTFDSKFTPGLVRGAIVDARGTSIPAKVEFRPVGEGTTPNFGPHSAETGVGNLVYTASGSFERTIPPGEYDVVVSHGPEYDAVFTKLTVPAAGEAKLNATLKRVVDTTGWVSADYHSHSSPSGDNTGSQLGRIYNLVAEHVEFAPCTEHNRISTYEGHIAALGIADRIRTVSGMELTGSPLPLNHQNVFPLVRKPRTQDGGGPVTDTDVERQVERLALWDERSRKVIQQNHPDIGWLLYDRNGDGEPDEGHARIVPHLDVMEIHPISVVANLGPDGKSAGNNRIFNWLQLLNQGYRIKGVVNTDAHYNFHGSGGLRIWVRSSTDDPRDIDIAEMIENSEKGRIVMSNGPFLEFEVVPAGAKGRRASGPGDDLVAKGGNVNVSVRVQCPNWIDVDRVFLLVNGRVSKEFDFGADAIAEDVVRFERSAELTLEKDAHLIAVAVGAKSTLGVVQGPNWGRQHPAAVTNPVWVDVDGNGFEPNGDTLGVPLPVKFGSRK